MIFNKYFSKVNGFDHFIEGIGLFYLNFEAKKYKNYEES